MRTTTLALVLILVVAAAPADAYEGRKRCSAEAEDCISEMVRHFENRGWVGIELTLKNEGANYVRCNQSARL